MFVVKKRKARNQKKKEAKSKKQKLSKSDKQGSDKITWDKQGTSYQSPSSDTPMAGINFETGFFKNGDVNPGGILELFENYINKMPLIYGLAFHKAGKTSYMPTDKEKKAMLLLGHVDDLKDLFQHIGGVTDTDTYAETIQKINDELSCHINSIV